ncbi:OmpA family protein [Granulicella sp. L60]|uniref:OmpA family protein n=1 Tax=Granulicella sp. L60 TaxID=1641866 RepID=UPI001C2045D1|nr:OmpA family protein [Granulicella sp. L60]
MQNSSLATISAALPTHSIQSIASHFGASETTILDGLQSSVASVANGLAQKSGDQGFVSQVLKLASATPENAISSALSNGSLTTPASTFLTGGSQFLSTIFGGRLSAITEALGSKTGLRTSAASTLLAIGAQTVLGFIGSKVRDGSVSLTNLPSFLTRESDALKGLLPEGFHRQPVPVSTHKVDVNPVIAQSVRDEERRSILPWLLGLLVLALLLGFWWNRSHQPIVATQPETTVPAVSAPVPATITSSTGADLGTLVDATLPDSTTLHIPERGVEGKLLAFIKDPARSPDKTSWFDFDRLLFDTGSDTLQPQSADQLNNIAAILKAYPAVHLTIGGYTDNTGDAAQNLKLSQDRANSVVNQLETMGIDRTRLVAKGYGEDHPVADNSTADGRALNRRISMLVTAK